MGFMALFYSGYNSFGKSIATSSVIECQECKPVQVTSVVLQGTVSICYCFMLH